MVQKDLDLSIVILSFNVKDFLLKCLESVFKDPNSKNWQVIVVDNASSDNSSDAVKEYIRGSHSSSGRHIELVQNKENLGFAGGNNSGISKVKSPVVLFLNPDTVVADGAISKSLDYLLSNPDIGALSCRVELPDGKLDYSCHRGFPTPWNSLAYFSGLSKIFPNVSFFSGYTASYLDIKTIHQIDCINGAFLMVRKIAGDQIKWWDSDYFFNGEDIEFCFNLKEKGWKIYFYPEVKIIHYKGSSSGLESQSKVKVDREKMLKTASHAASAMRIFYLKHFYKKYPIILRDFVLLGIKSLEHFRKAKIRMGMSYK